MFSERKPVRAMAESAKRHSDGLRGRDKQQSDRRDANRRRDERAGKKRDGRQAQKDAAMTQPPFPGEPAKGE
jgi:hypothetical protein